MAEAWRNRAIRQHDFDRGIWPKPKWAEVLTHLNIGTKTGACGQGGFTTETWPLGYMCNPFGCFQTVYVRWVTCKVCLVRLDWWISKGQAEIDLVERKNPQPALKIIKPLEANVEWGLTAAPKAL